MTFSYFHAFLKLSFRIYLLWRLDEPLTDRITLRKSNICNCQRFIRFRRIYYERGLRNVGCLALWKWTSGVSVACMVLSYFSQLSIYLSIFYYFFSQMANIKWNFCDSTRLERVAIDILELTHFSFLSSFSSAWLISEITSLPAEERIDRRRIVCALVRYVMTARKAKRNEQWKKSVS